MKSRLAIVREYARIKRLNKSPSNPEHSHVYGALQALAWAMDDHAMRPSKAFNPKNQNAR